MLLALGANSPIWHGRNTGFASWRAVLMRTWPASGPPPHLEDAAAYDRQVERFRSMGVIAPDDSVNWTLRLSDRVVGVEIRVGSLLACGATGCAGQPHRSQPLNGGHPPA